MTDYESSPLRPMTVRTPAGQEVRPVIAIVEARMPGDPRYMRYQQIPQTSEDERVDYAIDGTCFISKEPYAIGKSFDLPEMNPFNHLKVTK